MKDLLSIDLERDDLFDAFLEVCFGKLLPRKYRSNYITKLPNIPHPVNSCAVNFPGMDWEHVMLAFDCTEYKRTPSYEEMIFIHEKFFMNDEISLQVHPPKSEYINVMPYCLHLWRDKNISNKYERILKSKIQTYYEQAKKFFVPNQRFSKELSIGNKKIVAFFGGTSWPTWEEVRQVKNDFWDEETPAIQYVVSKEFNLNPEFLIILVDASDMILPPKELV